MSEIGVGQPWGPEASPYEALGSEAGVRALVEMFYDKVEATAPTLRAMLPKNTTTSRQKLFEFLSGWAGGPALYWERHGHPRLRMRHAPFAVDQYAALDWVRCMDEALSEMAISDSAKTFMSKEMTNAARNLINE